ncbi:hypothetical protein EYB33_07910 [Lysinibacillus sphaericus]|uniref:Uncharacterized protein n=2 Tax=Lysinibacillus TaxID=400634 RepID=A0A2S5D2C6_LYSSH|nr:MULTISPECIES: hypothetical protein [Lysinibacillus]AHN24056.1 hypothetical protein T479_07290 [Lysinibacillus varians]MCS1382560.1 hypothetical protein [Lysinibacillus sphaericus]POZ57236.1 hypothetical protein LYSIN_02020 [Lysinibacillus sphaericus]TKI67339.1 hypothetical protein FC752_02130 [Lysinibacillus varians]UDK96225.1 hypothetical protein EYB33_07910 [Lysinibacillus sphaericus]
MKASNNRNLNRNKVDRYAMALAYQEMGKLNLKISEEMEHLEIETMKTVEAFLKTINILIKNT